MTPTARRYALIRVRAGDYLCPSNDGLTLWRFSAYEDGADYGLVVAYGSRRFWKASRTPMPDSGRGRGLLDLDALDDLPWIESHAWIPSRKAAVAEVFCP